MDAAEGGSGAGGAWGDGNPVLHCRHVPASAAAEAPARRWGGLSGRRCAAACAGAALAAAACCMAIKGWPYGATRAVELTASSGSRQLDEAALAAARASTFEPATRNRAPVESEAVANYRFELR